MKKYIYITAITFGMLLCGRGVTEAATVDSSFNLNVNCNFKCQNEGLIVFRYKGAITETVHKTVNFVNSSGHNVSQSFVLNLEDSVTLKPEPTTGDWFITGGYYDSPPSDGVLYEVLLLPHQLRFKIGTSIPMDSNNFVIESADPSVVSCEGGLCKAIGGGTTNITVSFPKTKQAPSPVEKTCVTKKGDGPFSPTTSDNTSCNMEYEVDGSNVGYGKINFMASQETLQMHRETVIFTTVSKPVLKTYSFPSITYTVTVPSVSNTPQATACNGIGNITASGATINWTYSDADNDPQTNYSIEVATDPAFNNMYDSWTAPDNTDVTNVRSINITGLGPNTQYYARVKSYNDTNDWRDYGTCVDGFKTTDGPVNGVCSIEKNKCDDGNPGSTTDNQWVCNGINGGANSDTCFVPALTCFSSQRKAVKGEEVKYIASPDDGESYRWFDGDNQISGEESSSYKTSYQQTGSYNRSVVMNKSGKTESATCSTVTVGCGINPNENNCSIDGIRTKYSCQSDGTWQPEGTTTCTVVPTLGKFLFKPNRVAVGGFCKLFVDVQNATVCQLENKSNQVIPLTNAATKPKFTVNGIDRPVGTYKLFCKSTTSAPFLQMGVARTCDSNSEATEK